MQGWLSTVKIFLPLFLAFALHRKSFDSFNDFISYIILAATFGLVIETITIPVFKVLKLPVKIHFAVFYTFVIVITLLVILLYNKNNPVVAKLIFINGNAKTEVCAEGKCLKFKPNCADIFDFRRPALLKLNNTTYKVERGIYILNLNGDAEVFLYRIKSLRKLSKTKIVADVEKRTLGVYKGFAKIWNDSRAEVYLNETPPKNVLIRYREALSVFYHKKTLK